MRLEAALHHMDIAYQTENLREYELTKHLSLRLRFPIAFLRLRATGRCEIDTFRSGCSTSIIPAATCGASAV